jgi:pantoate--beta-alanine ligase
MQRVTTLKQLAEAVASARERELEVALVPTMGALHDGHLSLIREARRHTPFVVVSIFVNPLQFGAGEDFDKYPRDIEADAEKLRSMAVDVLFTPTVNDLYRGNMDVTESAGKIGDLYEGAARPGHFDGMLTVVARLFEAVRADYAVFGAKDAQQLFLIRQMAKAKFPNLKVIEAPTIREASGLAMSSRNQYLDNKNLEVASKLSAALRVGQGAGAISPALVIDAVRNEMLKVPEAKLDYIALVEADTFEPVVTGFSGRAVLLIAAVVGQTRLIDNIDIKF